MKYSQTIGVAAALLMIAVCFLPWSFIASSQLTISGMQAAGTNFGKPGLFNLIMGFFMIVLFLVPAIWSKRANVLLAALNLAWAFRNYLLLSACMMGECPEQQPALYMLLGLSLLIQVMTFLPSIPMPDK